MSQRVTLEVDLKGVRLPTPVLGASGCFGSGQEIAGIADIRRVGGIITKSVTIHPVRGLPPPRMVETPSGMLNAIGLQNPGASGFIRKDGPFIARAGVPVIVSVAGRDVQEFAEVTAAVSQMPGVVAIEANLSSPNSRAIGARVFAKDQGASADVVNMVTRATHLPVFAKLTPDVTDIVPVAESCIRAGAHGLSLVNTLMGMAIDVDSFRPKLGAITGGLSGPAMRAVAVRCVYQVAKALPKVPIIGMGGVRTAEDAIELLLAGAWAVAIGTANFFNPHATSEVAQGIGRFLQERGMTSPADLRGRVVIPDVPVEPAYRSG